MSPPRQACCVTWGRLLCPFWAPATIRESALTCSLRSSEAGWGAGGGWFLPPPRSLLPSRLAPARPGAEAWPLVPQLKHWLAI